MKVLLITGTAAVALAALSSCREPLAPPDNASPITPPAEYAAAWQQVQQCSGRLGRFERVRWYVVHDSTIACPAGECSGVWYPPHDIYLTARHVNDAGSDYFVARHEMLHDLLQDVDHPKTFCTCRLGGTEREMGGCSTGAE